MNSIIIHYILHTCKKLLHKYIHTHQTQYRKEIWKKKYRKLFQIQGLLPRKLILLLIEKCWSLHDFSFLILEPVQFLQGIIGVHLSFLISNCKLSRFILKSNRSLRPLFASILFYFLWKENSIWLFSVLATTYKKERKI